MVQNPSKFNEEIFQKESMKDDLRNVGILEDETAVRRFVLLAIQHKGNLNNHRTIVTTILPNIINEFTIIDRSKLTRANIAKFLLAKLHIILCKTDVTYKKEILFLTFISLAYLLKKISPKQAYTLFLPNAYFQNDVNISKIEQEVYFPKSHEGTSELILQTFFILLSLNDNNNMRSNENDFAIAEVSIIYFKNLISNLKNIFDEIDSNEKLKFLYFLDNFITSLLKYLAKTSRLGYKIELQSELLFAVYSSCIILLPCSIHKFSPLEDPELRVFVTPLTLLKHLILPMFRLMFTPNFNFSANLKIFHEVVVYLKKFMEISSKYEHLNLRFLNKLSNLLDFFFLLKVRKEENLNLDPCDFFKLIKSDINFLKSFFLEAAKYQKLILIFFIPLLEQLVTIEENWPGCSEIFILIFQFSFSAELKSDTKPLKEKIKKWIITTACSRFTSNETGMAPTNNKFRSGYRLLNARLFCIGLLGSRLLLNYEIFLCLLSLFDDNSLDIRNSCATSCAIYSLNKQMSTTRIDFYHDKDNNCLNYTRANQEVFTKSCVKVLLDTLNDYYNYSIKKNSKFCGSWKELASFSTWASALSKHIFITCPLIKNIHQEKNSFLMDYRYQLFEFFFNEMFVKVSLLQEKIELDLQKDLTLKFRQCITMVVTGFIEGTKDDSKKCLFNFDLQLFLIFFPLLSQLREDSSFYIRKMILEFLGSLIGIFIPNIYEQWCNINVSELTSTQEQFLLCLKHLVNKFDTDSPFFGTKLGLIDEKPVLKALIAKFKNLNFQNLKIKKFINKSEQHNIADQFSKDLNNKKNENIFSRYDTVEMPVQKKRELIFTPSHLYQPVEENSSFDNFLPLSNKVSIEKEQRKEISDYEGLVENHLKKIKNLENEIKLEGNGVISDNKNGELDLISSTSENNGLNHKNMNTFSNNKYENDSKTKFNLHTGLAAPNTFIHSNDNPKLETSKIFLESDNPLYHSFNHAVDAFEIEADELFQQSSIIYNDFLEEHKGGTAHVDSFQCTSNAMKNVDDDHNENQYLDILEKDHPSSKHELRFNQKTKFLENADDYKKMNSSASELNNNNFQTKKNSINSNQVSVPEVKNAQTKKNSINSNQVSVPEVKNAVTKTENLNSETFPYLQSVQILTDDPNQILSAEDRLKIQITENESFDGLKIQEQNLNKFENLKSKDISNNGAYNESPGLSSEENKPMLASVSQALNSVLQEKNIKSQKKFQLKQNLSNIVDNGLRNQKVVKNLQETETLVCENQNYSNSDAGKLKLADPNDVNIHESVFEQNVNHNSVQSKVDGKLIDDQIASNSKIDGTKLNDTTVRPMLNQCSSVNAELDKRQQFPLQKEDSILKKIEDKKESSDIFELVSESDHVHNKNKEISFFSKNVEQQISTMSPQSLQYDKQLECDLGIQAKDMQTADTSLHELFEGEMMMDEIFTEDNTKRREEVVDLTTLFSKLTKTNPLNNSSFQHEIKNEESSSYNNKFNENLTEDFEGRHFDMKKKLAVKSVTTNNEKYFDDNLVSNPPSFLATKDEFSQTDINSFKIVNIDENVTNGFENENINSYKGNQKSVSKIEIINASDTVEMMNNSDVINLNLNSSVQNFNMQQHFSKQQNYKPIFIINSKLRLTLETILKQLFFNSNQFVKVDYSIYLNNVKKNFSQTDLFFHMRDSENTLCFKESLHISLKKIFKLDLNIFFNFCENLIFFDDFQVVNNCWSDTVKEVDNDTFNMSSDFKILNGWVSGLAAIHKHLLPVSRILFELEASLGESLTLSKALIICEDQLKIKWA